MRKFILPCLALVAFLISGIFSSALAATAEEYYKAGIDLYNQKEYAQSIDYLKAAVQQDPNHWQAYQTLGLCYYFKNRIVEALAAFDKSLALHDNRDLKKFADTLRNFTPVPTPTSGPGQATTPSPTPANPKTAASKPIDDGVEKAALAQYRDGTSLREKSQETLKQYGQNHPLSREGGNISKYGVPNLSRDNRKLQIGFQIGSPTIGGLDIGYSLEPTMNVGLSFGFLSETSYYNSMSYWAVEPRIKWYSSPNDVSFFFGLGVLFGGVSNTDSYGYYNGSPYSNSSSSTNNTSWVGPNFKLGFSVVDNAGLFFELDWSIGILILTIPNYYGTYNYSTNSYSYASETLTLPAAIPGLRIGYAF